MNPILWIIELIFGCRHGHQSRVFTIKRRTYRVCFDCGREFDLPDVHERFGNHGSSIARLESNHHGAG